MIERYQTQEMKELWSDENKFKTWLKVEIVAVEVLCKHGIVPEASLKVIKNKANFDKEARPLDKGLWDGAVDTVGGNILANVLAQTKDSGIVAACGNASDIKLNTTVMPFIIRGVKLWGINSVNASNKRRKFIWNEASNLIDFEKLNESIKEISLEELLNIFPKMLKGETSGRYIINLNK